MLIYNGAPCYASSAYLALVEEAKIFSAVGMNITLSDSFTVVEDPTPYTAGFDSDRVAITVTKESLKSIADAGLDITMSLKTYAEIIISGYKLTSSVVEENGMTYFNYLAALESGEMVTMLACVYKSADAYWLIQFITPTSNYTAEKATLFNYAKSVTFNG